MPYSSFRPFRPNIKAFFTLFGLCLLLEYGCMWWGRQWYDSDDHACPSCGLRFPFLCTRSCSPPPAARTSASPLVWRSDRADVEVSDRADMEISDRAGVPGRVFPHEVLQRTSCKVYDRKESCLTEITETSTSVASRVSDMG